MTWLARVASVASLSNGFAQAIDVHLRPAPRKAAARVLLIALPLALSHLDQRRRREARRALAVGLTIAKIVPLVLLIVVGVFAIDWLARSSRCPRRTRRSLGEAALLLLFAYAGFENTAAAAGEFKNPRRDVPFALIAMHRCGDAALHAGAARGARHAAGPRGTRAEGAPLADAAVIVSALGAGS